MRVREMRELSGDELRTKIDDTRKEMIELRFQLATRKLENPAKLRLAKQRLSRLLTIQTESSKTSSKKK
jgi:large subunit ribosomal protein L29